MYPSRHGPPFFLADFALSVAVFSCASPSDADDARSVPDPLPSLVFLARERTEFAAWLGSSWLELALRFDFGVGDEEVTGAVFRFCMMSNATTLKGILARPGGKGVATPFLTAET